MALDPESQRLIDLMVAANRPAWNTLSPQDARAQYLALRPAAQGPRPAEVKVVDSTIPGPAGELPVRIAIAGGVVTAGVCVSAEERWPNVVTRKQVGSAPASTACAAASIWSGVGEVNTWPGQAASSMPVPTRPACIGSWPEPPPEISATLPGRVGAARVTKTGSACSRTRRAMSTSRISNISWATRNETG